MKRSNGKPLIHRKEPDAAFLKKRLEQISQGMQEGIRREVARLRQLGLPIIVEENGVIKDLSKDTESMQ